MLAVIHDSGGTEAVVVNWSIWWYSIIEWYDIFLHLACFLSLGKLINI